MTRAMAQHDTEGRQPQNILDWLERVRSQPFRYGATVQLLEHVIFGFYEALRMQQIVDPSPSLQKHFRDWLLEETDLDHLNCGWGYAIDSASGSPKKAFSRFFTLLDRYKLLKPRVVATVRLGAIGKSTRSEVLIASADAFESHNRPDRIDVIQYFPSSLHHLRFWHGNTAEDRTFLMTPDCSRETSLNLAKKKVVDEFDLRSVEWE